MSKRLPDIKKLTAVLSGVALTLAWAELCPGPGGLPLHRHHFHLYGFYADAPNGGAAAVIKMMDEGKVYRSAMMSLPSPSSKIGCSMATTNPDTISIWTVRCTVTPSRT